VHTETGIGQLFTTASFDKAYDVLL